MHTFAAPALQEACDQLALEKTPSWWRARSVVAASADDSIRLVLAASTEGIGAKLLVRGADETQRLSAPLHQVQGAWSAWLNGDEGGGSSA